MEKKDLKEYRSLKCELAELEDRIASVQEQRARAARSYERVNTSHRGDLSDDMIKLEELIESWHKKNDSILDILHAIEAEIDSIDNPTERRLLRLRYIDGYSWEAIARIMGYSEQYIYTMHGHALKKIRVNNS